MIETDRLILRPWRETDAAALYKYASDPDIGPIAGWPPHKSVDESLEIIRTVFADPEVYAVVLKSTGEPVGSCAVMFSNSLHTADMAAGEGEIGYWIGKPYWGQGFIPEAVRALVSRSFDDLNLDAVWCGHYEGNNKSKRVCEKCGFKYHHTNENIVSPLGDIRTEHFYRLTKDEYDKLRKNMTSIRKTKYILLGITLAVMLFMPFAVAKLTSECAGMVLCMMTFFIVDPLYSAILGFICGKNIREMWWLPLAAALAFLAGVWIFLDMGELWFIAYAAVYLLIGWLSMWLGKCLIKA